MDKYTLRPPEFEAVQVTKENINDVAKWCNGVVEYYSNPAYDPFIKIPNHIGYTHVHTENWVIKEEYTHHVSFRTLINEEFQKQYVRL